VAKIQQAVRSNFSHSCVWEIHFLHSAVAVPTDSAPGSIYITEIVIQASESILQIQSSFTAEIQGPAKYKPEGLSLHQVALHHLRIHTFPKCILYDFAFLIQLHWRLVAEITVL
jgi:hypothetical protein